ncbi:MAG: 30S ribosomal protein S8 [Acidobacteriota bacterium]
MMTSDPIADMLTRIRNGLSARHTKVDVPASRLKTEIAKILKDEGFIANYKLTDDGPKKSIRIYLKYTPGNMPVISRIERVSRPGCRVYVGSKEVPRVLGRFGCEHPDNAGRSHDRRLGAQSRRGRRSVVPGLVSTGKELVGATYVTSW